VLQTCQDDVFLSDLPQVFSSVVNLVYDLGIYNSVFDSKRRDNLYPLSHILADPLHWPNLRTLTLVNDTIDVYSLVDIVVSRAAFEACALQELFLPAESVSRYPSLEASVRGLVHVSPMIRSIAWKGDILGVAH